jgi:hypothetical protein
MADWGPTVAEELRRDVRFALTFKVGKNRRPLTDSERDMVADAIVEIVRSCLSSGRAAPSGKPPVMVRIVALLIFGALLGACSGSNRVEDIVPGCGQPRSTRHPRTI